MSHKRAKGATQPDPATENFEAGCSIVSATPLLGPLWAHTKSSASRAIAAQRTAGPS